MAALVTLLEAQAHLRVTSTSNDGDISRKIDQASLTIVQYLKSDEAAAWTAVDAPADVKAAVLLLLTHLYRQRGDDMSGDTHLWDALTRLLMRRRDPALA